MLADIRRSYDPLPARCPEKALLNWIFRCIEDESNEVSQISLCSTVDSATDSAAKAKRAAQYRC